MADIRKYEVRLDEGRIVSRQRAYQLKNPDSYKKSRDKYLSTEAGKNSRNNTYKKCLDNFKATHNGMSYSQARKAGNNVNKE